MCTIRAATSGGGDDIDYNNIINNNHNDTVVRCCCGIESISNDQESVPTDVAGATATATITTPTTRIYRCHLQQVSDTTSTSIITTSSASCCYSSCSGSGCGSGSSSSLSTSTDDDRTTDSCNDVSSSGNTATATATTSENVVVAKKLVQFSSNVPTVCPSESPLTELLKAHFCSEGNRSNSCNEIETKTQNGQKEKLLINLPEHDTSTNFVSNNQLTQPGHEIWYCSYELEIMRLDARKQVRKMRHYLASKKVSQATSISHVQQQQQIQPKHHIIETNGLSTNIPLSSLLASSSHSLDSTESISVSDPIVLKEIEFTSSSPSSKTKKQCVYHRNTSSSLSTLSSSLLSLSANQSEEEEDSVHDTQDNWSDSSSKTASSCPQQQQEGKQQQKLPIEQFNSSVHATLTRAPDSVHVATDQSSCEVIQQAAIDGIQIPLDSIVATNIASSHADSMQTVPHGNGICTTTTATATTVTESLPLLALDSDTRGLEQRVCSIRQRRQHMTIKYIVNAAGKLVSSTTTGSSKHNGGKRNKNNCSSSSSSAKQITHEELASLCTLCSEWATTLAKEEATRDYIRAYCNSPDSTIITTFNDNIANNNNDNNNNTVVTTTNDNNTKDTTSRLYKNDHTNNYTINSTTGSSNKDNIDDIVTAVKKRMSRKKYHMDVKKQRV